MKTNRPISRFSKINNVSRERAKNVVLAVLTICMVLLLYFLWQSVNVNPPINLAIKEKEAFKSSEIFRPSTVYVCSGEAYYKNAQMWGPRFLALASDFLDQEMSVEEITDSQFDEIMRYPSIIASFNYTVPYDNFCEEFGISKTVGRDRIEKLGALGYSAETPGNLFLYDKGNQKYYRFYDAADNAYLDELNEIIREVNDNDSALMYKLSRLLGREVSSNAMLPAYLDVELAEIPFIHDFDVMNQDNVRDIAESYFGRNLDFVRKIQEKNGTKIFMYGYGEQTLILYPTGETEYKDTPNVEPDKTDYFGGLQIALDFIAKHGGFDSIGGTVFTPYLFEVESIQGGKGYKYIFGVKYGGYRLYSEEGMPFEADVIGDRVVYFKRAIVHCTSQIRDNSHSGDGDNGMKTKYDPINMLAANYGTMKNILIEADQFKSGELKSFEELAMKITKIRYGYLIMHGEDVLKPAWIISAGDIDMYFDLYTAEELGYGLVRGD